MKFLIVTIILIAMIKINLNILRKIKIYKLNKCQNKKICLLKKNKINCLFCKSYYK